MRAYDALSYDSMLAFGGQLCCVSFTYKVDLPNRTWSIFEFSFHSVSLIFPIHQGF